MLAYFYKDLPHFLTVSEHDSLGGNPHDVTLQQAYVASRAAVDDPDIEPLAGTQFKIFGEDSSDAVVDGATIRIASGGLTTGASGVLCGSVFIYGGNNSSTVNVAAGDIRLEAGTSGSGNYGNGGDVDIVGGTCLYFGGVQTPSGGDVNITGGNAAGSGCLGGDINLAPGSGDTRGTINIIGDMRFSTTGATYYKIQFYNGGIVGSLLPDALMSGSTSWFLPHDRGGLLALDADVTDVENDLATHTSDSTIHFTEASIDHTAIQNIGTNTHTQIDTHISDSTLHFTEASIDHTAIQNIGTNTHAQIDTHVGDSTIHFTEASIDHGAISGLAGDDHTQYLNETRHDALASDNPHSVTLDQATTAGSTTTNDITIGSLTSDGLDYPTSDGTDGQAITTDGSGTLGFETVSGVKIVDFTLNQSISASSTYTHQIAIGSGYTIAYIQFGIQDSVSASAKKRMSGFAWITDDVDDAYSITPYLQYDSVTVCGIPYFTVSYRPEFWSYSRDSQLSRTQWQSFIDNVTGAGIKLTSARINGSNVDMVWENTFGSSRSVTIWGFVRPEIGKVVT